jgi:group I intron endonuclease
MNSYGIIYKITNKINGKVYIGQTAGKNPNRRIKTHYRKSTSIDLVYKAFLKYGESNLETEIICSTNSLENLNFLEQYFINYYNSIVPNGYNIKHGGEQGGKCSDYLKEKISKLAKERYQKYGSPMKGIKFTKEHCDNLSKVRKGFDSEARKKAREKTHTLLSYKVKAINISTGEELIFKSLEQCAKALNLQASNISRVLNKKQNRTQHKGFKFFKLDK